MHQGTKNQDTYIFKRVKIIISHDNHFFQLNGNTKLNAFTTSLFQWLDVIIHSFNYTSLYLALATPLKSLL